MSTALGGVDYASADHGVLGMAANKGITFDLDAIRRANSKYRILRFRAVAGNPYVLPGNVFSSADVWVFVDGSPHVRVLNINAANSAGPYPLPINVAINDTDRFLTLVASDGGDTIYGDRVIFGDPRLELQGSAIGETDNAQDNDKRNSAGEPPKEGNAQQ